MPSSPLRPDASARCRPPARHVPKADVAKLEQTKSSVARIRRRIAEQYPQLEDEEVLDELIPKKCVMTIAKTSEKNAVIVVDGAPLFFQLRDGPYFPPRLKCFTGTPHDA